MWKNTICPPAQSTRPISFMIPSTVLNSRFVNYRHKSESSSQAYVGASLAVLEVIDAPLELGRLGAGDEPRLVGADALGFIG